MRVSGCGRDGIVMGIVGKKYDNANTAKRSGLAVRVPPG